MLALLLVLSISFLFAAPSQAQVENGYDPEGSSKVIISDSTAIRALEEAKSCIEIYRNALKMQSKSRIVDAFLKHYDIFQYNFLPPLMLVSLLNLIL